MKKTTFYSLAGLLFNIAGLLIILAGIFFFKSAVSVFLGILLQVLGMVWIAWGNHKKKRQSPVPDNQNRNQI